MAAPFDLFSYYIYLALFGGFGGFIYYMYELRNMFPIKELQRAGPPVAFFANNAGEIKFIKIKDIKGRTFNCKFGAYQLADDRRYDIIGGKRDAYFYHIGNGNPISVESIGRLADYLDEVKQPYLTIKDVKDAAMNEKLSAKLKSKGLLFLQRYFEIDMFAKADVIYESSTNKRFRLSLSNGIIAWRPQKAIFWRNIGIYAVNDRAVDFQRVQVEQKVNGSEIETQVSNEKYGTITVRDARTRLRRGKTSVFIGAVRTIQA